MSDLIATHQVPRAKRMAELCAQQPSNPVMLTDSEIDDMAFGYCPSGKIGELRELIRVVEARIVGQQTKGGGNG